MSPCQKHPNRSGLQRWHRGPKGDSPCLIPECLCLACWREREAHGWPLIQHADGRPWSPSAPFTGLAKEQPAPFLVPPTPEVPVTALPTAAIACIGCGQVKPLKAKDRCPPCYNRHYRAQKKITVAVAVPRTPKVRAIDGTILDVLSDGGEAQPTPTDEHTGIDLAQVRQSVLEAQTDAAVRQAALAALEKVIGRWPDAVPMSGRAQVELVLARMARGLKP